MDDLKVMAILNPMGLTFILQYSIICLSRTDICRRIGADLL
jgi:hypothetical protein